MTKMAACRLALCALTLAVLCGAAAAKKQQQPPLSLGIPLLSVLPDGCGSVYVVQPGDTCQSIANWANITLAQYTQLNPLALCGILAPAPGSLVCAGDDLSFCSNLYTTARGDTCKSITKSIGPIIAMDSDVKCNKIPAGTDVCVAPSSNACAVDTLCGVSIPPALQDMLGTAPDYCTIANECQAALTSGTTAGKPSLTLSLTSVTPAVQSVVSNTGHPELRAFASQPAGSQMDVTFVPGVKADPSSAIVFALSTGGNARKLLTDGVKGGQTQVPRGNYGYGRR